MAIPQGVMSSTPVIGAFLPPEDRPFLADVSYEKGPLAIGDVSLGLLYQDWNFTYEPGTGVITATPETTGSPVDVFTASDITYFTCTFDQNARITISYITPVSSFLFWFDTELGGTTIRDIGNDVFTVSIYLDDKRDTQSSVNDMLAWYTRSDGGGLFNLYMRVQRDRFQIENEMLTGIPEQYIWNVGITDELRIQLRLSTSPPPGS